MLARPIYGSKFEILLAEGMTLGSLHIKRVNDLGYPGVYVLDGLSEDIVVHDIIPADLRLKTIKAAKELLEQAENGSMQRTGRKVTSDAQQKIVMPLIETLIANKRRIVDLIDLKPFEDYNYYHAANVVVLSLLVGVELGISGTQLYELGMAALLHDVGNIFIPKAILQKPGKLTTEEYDIIKQHTEMGFQFLRDHFEISIEACIGALQHHENYDGTGYPGKLKRNKISIYGRIIAVCDVYDAMVSRRPFRQPMYPVEAMEYISSKAETMFDPEIVGALDRMIAHYPSGSCVELSSGVRCIVVENFQGNTGRPRLRLINKLSKTPMYIDLNSDKVFENVRINQIVQVG